MSDGDDDPSLPLDPSPLPHPDDDDDDPDHDDDDSSAAAPAPAPAPADPPAAPPPTVRRPQKRKKLMSVRHRAAVEKKLRSLKGRLHPVPFLPPKSLDLSRHEALFRRLGLWEFAHLELDREIRGDLLALLVANFNPANRSSVVNDFRIKVSRADLARALKLPVKKEKAALEIQDVEAADDRPAMAAVEDFVSYYVLLHEEDTWMMPDEVSNWVKVIKEGQPQKLDVAGLIWFMVERELSQGQQLEYCYYASHLQLLMKCQRPELFVEEAVVEEKEVAPEAEIEVIGSGVEDVKLPDAADEARDTELSLGYDKVEGDHEQQFVGNDDQVELDECKQEEEQVENYRDWVLQGKMNSNVGEHPLRRCDSLNVKEEEEEEGRFDMHVKFARLDSLRSSDLIQDMGANDGSFNIPMELIDPQSGGLMSSRMELLKSMSVNSLNQGGPSVFEDPDRRGAHEEEDVPHFSRGDPSAKIGSDVPWDNRYSSFDICINQTQVFLSKAKMMYEEKEHECNRAHMQIQTLSQAVHERDEYIRSLEAAKIEEQSKRDLDIYRFQREFGVMTELLHGYKKALRMTQKAFAEYRENHKQQEDPIYKDVDGSGGLVLSVGDLEKLRLEKEEEEKAKRGLLEEMIRKCQHDGDEMFNAHFEQVRLLAERLKIVEEGVETLRGIRKCKEPTRTLS